MPRVSTDLEDSDSGPPGPVDILDKRLKAASLSVARLLVVLMIPAAMLLVACGDDVTVVSESDPEAYTRQFVESALSYYDEHGSRGDHQLLQQQGQRGWRMVRLYLG